MPNTETTHQMLDYTSTPSGFHVFIEAIAELAYRLLTHDPSRDLSALVY